MKVLCSDCGRPLGTLAGRLLAGWVMLCADCNKKRKKATQLPDFMRGIFGKGKG